MSKLRLLKIGHADHVGGNFGHLPRGLKWLSWEGFPSKSITISHLEEHAVLDISGSMQLSHIEGISGLPLKELNLQNCTMLRSLPELPPSLIRLNVSGCTSMNRLPNLSNLKNLEDLCLVSCHDLAEIWGLESLESLINLDVTGCSTYFKTLGMIDAKGTIRGAFDKGVIEKDYGVPNGDNIKGTILYFVYHLPGLVGRPVRFCIEAKIQRNDGKKIRCRRDLRTRVSMSQKNEDRVYSCYFPGLTWLGFPLKNGDKIKVNVEVQALSTVLINERAPSVEMVDFVMEYEAIGDSQQLGKRVNHLITSRLKEGVDGAKKCGCEEIFVKFSG